LRAGDPHFFSLAGGQALLFEVEFIAFDGNTVAVETLEAGKIRPIQAREMPHVRDSAAA
jgi:hypothetical protein